MEDLFYEPVDEISNPDDVDIMIRERQYLRNEIDEIKDRFESEMARLGDRMLDLISDKQERLVHLNTAIMAWHKGEGKTSVTWPSGHVSIRKGRQSINIDDNEAVVQWCLDNNIKAVKQVNRVSVKDLKAVMIDETRFANADGEPVELPDEISIETGPETLVISDRKWEGPSDEG